MGFFYSINRPGDAAAPRVLTNDLWLIYRHACARADTPPGMPPPQDPGPCQQRPFVWDAANTSAVPADIDPPKNVGGFLQGVFERFANAPVAQAGIQQAANGYGVGAHTTLQA
jgi:hypothetical protein